VANRIEHPGTVRVLDDDIAEDGGVFMVMDQLDGETSLARWARSGGKLGAREVVMVVCEALSVLRAAHAKGIVHRDRKPENLSLTRDETSEIDARSDLWAVGATFLQIAKAKCKTGVQNGVFV
jgi:serine/threonine protein kinase